MLCCGREKDSGRDLKSAQNTPSRQPLNMPFPQQQNQPQNNNKALGPPPLGMGPAGMRPFPNNATLPPAQQHSIETRDDYGKKVSQGETPFLSESVCSKVGKRMVHLKPPTFQPSGISDEVFRQLETVQNRYDSTTAEAFRIVQKSGEMVVRTLDPRQFIRLASETAPKINIDTNVSYI